MSKGSILKDFGKFGSRDDVPKRANGLNSRGKIPPFRDVLLKNDN
jgi:hypothetical protein